MMTSLINPSFQAISQDLLQLLQLTLQSHQFMNIDSPSFMDSSLGTSLAKCYDELQCSWCASEEDEAHGDMLNADLVDAGSLSMKQSKQSNPCGQTSNSHDDRPILMENQPRFELQMSTPPVRRFVAQSSCNFSLVNPEKPMPPPIVEYYSEDEEPGFEKVKQETAAESMKPECISLEETAARAKYRQVYTVENRRTPTIESLPGGFRFEEMEGVIQSEFESLLVSAAKPSELLEDPETQKTDDSPRIHGDEEQTFEKVKKQEFALRNVKPECVSRDESAATAKVLECNVHGAAGCSPKRTNKDIEHAGEKSNLATALARSNPKNTKSSRHPPLLNPVNVVVGISQLIAITANFATIW